MLGRLQLANRGGDMTRGSGSLPLHSEGKTPGSEDRVPLTTVTAAYSNVSVLSSLEDTKDFGETICHLPDSDVCAWNLHNLLL